MMFKVKMLAVSLLLFSLFVLNVYAETTEPALKKAPLNPAFTEYVKKIKTGKAQSITKDWYTLGKIPNPINRSYLKNRAVAPDKDSEASALFPSSYDLRTTARLTAVRNQGGCGSCWTFGTLASLESGLLPGETWDFSENNMKNTHGFLWTPCDGGNDTMGAAYLLRWSGPVLETADPYSTVDYNNSPSNLTVVKHTQNVHWLFSSNELKKSIMNHGAVAVSLYWEDTCYNSTNKAYYCNDSTQYTNHEVSVVGWDDSFSSTKFAQTPPGNGAWIIRNSWGSSWGQSGYFYLSYYDQTGPSEATLYLPPQSTTVFNHIYQYDPMGNTNDLGYSRATAWGANVFTAQSNDTIMAVGTYFLVPNASYELYIYKNVSSTGPRTGTLVYQSTGSVATSGFSTITLSSTVFVPASQKFSVVFRYMTPGYKYPIPVEYPVTEANSGVDFCTTASNAGESWMSSAGSSWTDLKNSSDSDIAISNVCIKAYAVTSTASAATITPPSFSFLPDIKMFKSASLTSNLFALADYNLGEPATSYNISTNFLGNTSLSGSTVSQAGYSTPTSGRTYFTMTNGGGTSSSYSLVRYSTYQMKKMPYIAMRPNSSEDFYPIDYAYDINGKAIPASFGDAWWVFSTSTVSSLIDGIFSSPSSIRLATYSGFTASSMTFYVNASPKDLATIADVTTATDITTEPFTVYPDLQKGGTFSSSSAFEANFGIESISGLTLPSHSYVSTVSDLTGRSLPGIISFGFTGGSQGIKLTPQISNMVNCVSTTWYTARIRVCSPTPGNTMEAQLYNFRGIIPGDSTVDLGANILFGVPTTWSWIDIPIYTTSTGRGYPQIILKASAPGTIYLQSVQYFSAPPQIMSAVGNIDSNYAYSEPSTISQLTTGWATSEIYGAETPAGVAFGFDGGALTLDYAGAATGNNQRGSKVTAKTAAGGIYTAAANPNYQAGMKMNVEKMSGTFNSYDAILLMACYGVASNGGADFWSAGGQLIASAQFGDISNGWHYLVAPVRRPWQQVQYMTKNSSAGKIKVYEVDYIRDMDEPNLNIDWYDILF